MTEEMIFDLQHFADGDSGVDGSTGDAPDTGVTGGEGGTNDPPENNAGGEGGKPDGNTILGGDGKNDPAKTAGVPDAAVAARFAATALSTASPLWLTA